MADRPTGGRRGARLTKPSEFQRVFDSPSRFSDSQFTILARANGQEDARLGFAISRRRLPSAVDRNHVKRIVRESFRLHRLRLQGFDIVVLAQHSIMPQDNDKLRKSLLHHWNRLARCERSSSR